MGLDMYAYTAPKDMIGDRQVDINDVIFTDGRFTDGIDGEFAYWRKFNNLHGWMKQLYLSKGGQHDDFNCNTLVLTLEDLSRLERDAANLEPVGGFFFGSMDDMTEADIEAVDAFIVKARQAIAEGKAVIYDSWW